MQWTSLNLNLTVSAFSRGRFICRFILAALRPDRRRRRRRRFLRHCLPRLYADIFQFFTRRWIPCTREV